MMDEQSANDGQSNMADDAENVPEMRDDALKYKSEAERVESFRCNWPIPQHINPKDLARDGFYYTRMVDRVKCAFCKGVLGNWESTCTYDPRNAHKQFFPNCPMVTGCASDNVPLPQSEEQVASQGAPHLHHIDSCPRMPGENDCGVTPADEAEAQNKPRQPVYKELNQRLQTYAGNYESFRGRELSEAGFYYEGPPDMVRCFWCDGRVEGWQPVDIPWEEHAKWYPGCAYLLRNRGANFIRSCRDSMTPEEKEREENASYQSFGIAFLKKCWKCKIRPRDIKFDKCSCCSYCLICINGEKDSKRCPECKKKWTAYRDISVPHPQVP